VEKYSVRRTMGGRYRYNGKTREKLEPVPECEKFRHGRSSVSEPSQPFDFVLETCGA
jgi:hypothetical protein